MLLLPHHHEFAETLATLPHFYSRIAKGTCETMHVIQRGPNLVPEITTTSQLREYLLGGEANEIVEFVDGYADNDVDDIEGDDGLLDWELSDEWIGSI